jgi:type VI secretion system protein ImpM
VSGTEIAQARVAGFYGKLPARGDFLSRRLEPDFIAAWDAWLQQVMSETREALGARWLECFLSAPVWRFVVPAGMYSKAGWVGLVVPSVDRVGRYFPLTLAAPVQEDSIDVPSTLAKAMRWLDSLEVLALEALRPQLDFDAFDQRLAGLALPAEVPVPSPASDDTVPLGATQAVFQVLQFDPGIADGVLRQVLEDPGRRLRASAALWLTLGGETLPPCLAACGGPVSGNRFCAMLDGRWADHSWTVALYCDPKTRGVDLFHGQGRGQGEAGPLIAPPGSASGADMNTGSEK